MPPGAAIWAQLHGAADNEFGERIENLAGWAVGQGGNRGPGAFDQLFRLAGGIGNRRAWRDKVADAVHLVGIVTLQKRAQQDAVFLGGVAQKMNDGKRQFSFLHVEAESFTDRGFVADDVENIILDLKSRADTQAVLAEVFGSGFIGAGKAGAKQAAGGAEDRGLAGDDLEIRLFIEIEIVAVVDLQKLAFADLIGGAADKTRGELRIEAGTKMKAVADEIIAQKDGGLVAAKMVDRRALAPKFSLIEHIIVHKRGHVNHLDHSGQDDMSIVDLSAGFAGEKHEHWPEHFAAEPADVFDEGINAWDCAVEFRFEALLDRLKLGFDAIRECFERKRHWPKIIGIERQEQRGCGKFRKN